MIWLDDNEWWTFTSIYYFIYHFKYFFILIDAISISELCLFLIKNAICGIAIAAYACYFGLNVKNSVTEVPQATQKAIVKSLIAIFFINAIFAMF